jgi:hypothetical protein
MEVRMTGRSESESTGGRLAPGAPVRHAAPQKQPVHGQHPHHPHTTEGCTSCVNEYITVLGQQRALLGELDALSQRQSLLIDEPVLDALLAVLEERQQVIDRIMATARTIEQLRAEWERVRERVPADHGANVDRELDAVMALAGEVQRRDERDHARLKARLDGVAAELAGLTTSKKAAAAYGQGPAAGARFQDHQG